MRGTRGGTPTKPKHTEESIQQALYWNHPILTKPAFEMVGFIFYAWESDYLAISKAGYVYECEIKISHSDFLNEAIHKQNKMRILQGLSASDGTIDDRRPLQIQRGSYVGRGNPTSTTSLPKMEARREREAAASLCRRSDDRQCDPRFAPHNQRHPEILTQNIYHHVVYNKSSL